MRVLRSSHAQMCVDTMAVQRTHKQSAAPLFAGVPRSRSERDLEKRLKLLNQQLYGKKEKLSLDSARDRDVRSEKIENPPSNIQHPTSSADVAYLRQDLLKILILAGLAFATELGLYFGKGVI